jgi:Resolvase, N terminal domain
MGHRATQLILPFEPALPDRGLILAPRLWPTMTPTAQQQLAKRVAQLLRSVLAAAGDLSGGHHGEHAAQFGKPGDHGASRQAGLYLRAQSTAGQVRQHQESTELQYRLVDRAALFGWPKERIEVIDDDLGKSGVSSDGRGGFQRLIAEIGLGKAGLVLSLDASRLARNNHDWHQLLELCSCSAY